MAARSWSEYRQALRRKKALDNLADVQTDGDGVYILHSKDGQRVVVMTEQNKATREITRETTLTRPPP